MAQQRYCTTCRIAFQTLDLKYCTHCGRPLKHARIPALVQKKITQRYRKPSYDTIILVDPCSYCDKMAWPMTIDHIEPQAHGGAKRSWTNRTGACYDCNQEKSDEKLLLFMLDRLC